ncbi:E3 ubiquitin/ISG15 ligase TRIM25-like [Mercenaria mercenaria]|uniref:E3 ubiquitin/ISG15 ligase TRIM25-like n=1 Tax=Mercenaria mercenaria TaxID=6596 RepID=UPI00234F7CF8|nr:E3 ubiquitin/ISG15 ligase TRIM25-like [Mercenaria mercenaria]
MAVSGRKSSDFSGSVSKGSAEDFDHECEPCLAIGQQIEAHGFCVDCQEYLCKNCFAYHQRIKATKNHQLLDKWSTGKHTSQRKDSVMCTEKCTLHGNKTIEFFCTQHDSLGCTVCITLNHRACKIDYIPDKCAGIGDTKEYRETMRNLEQKMKELDEVTKRANVEDKEIDTCHDKALQEIIKFRKEINDHLDQLQRKIQADIDKKKSADKQKVQEVIKICSNISTDISKLKSNLQDSKSSQQHGQLYINIKQAQSKLMSDEIQKAEKSLAQTKTQYIFERSKDLENAISRQEIFGKLSDPTNLVTPKKKKPVDKLTYKDDINVRIKSDQNDCYITGCAVLSSHKIVLADENNSKLKVVDRQSKVVIEEKSLDSKPWDITVLPQDQIAVTMPNRREIYLMSTASKLSIIHIQGNVQNTISLNNKVFDSPHYIVFNEDSRLIYISNYLTHNVVSITLQGDVSAVYEYKDVRKPLGMLMLEDGSLLVCCMFTGIIHRISGDLKQGQTMIDGLTFPRSICYNRHLQEVYIGCENQLKVFSLQ